MRKIFTVSHRTIIHGLALLALLFLAGYLRYTVVEQSVLLAPLIKTPVPNADAAYRGDAAEYFNYAYNLKHYGVYSKDRNSVIGNASIPKPDAMRTPGYPLFLLPFVGSAPDKAFTKTIQLWQVGLGILTVLCAFLLFNQLLGYWPAMTIALLTAVSPHLVNTTIYLLSENLFVLLLMLALLLFYLHIWKKTWFLPALIATGVVIGMASLTRPVLEYYLPLLLLLLALSYPWPKALKAIACLTLGFILVWGPWVARNYVSLGKTGDDHLMLATLHQGMYPGMMYQNNPFSLGYPNLFDKQYTKTNDNLHDVLTAIVHNFQEKPLIELRWYLLGKPVMLWSWNMISGFGDVFIYPISASPYASNSYPLFAITHSLMRGLHWLLILAGLSGCILVWFRSGKDFYGEVQLIVFRAISLLLIYNIGLLILGAPFPRYSIPFLPLIYGMAVSTIIPVAHNINKLRKSDKARSEKIKSIGNIS